MKYKAIVSDFDGTLADGSLVINEEVKRAIRDYIKSGGIFSIATGRDFYGALKDICIDLGTESLQIVRGGSEIVSAKTHKVVWGKYIDEVLLKELLVFLGSKLGIFYAAERGEIIYTLGGKAYELFGPKAKFGELLELPLDNVPKLVMPASLNEPDVIVDLLEEISVTFPNLHTIKTTYKDFVGMDINDGGVSKHLALFEYAKLMKLSPEEIIGVGDSYNDYPLLSACGYKVAMRNAPQELLDIVDLVVGTQEEDGILELLSMVKEERL